VKQPYIPTHEHDQAERPRPPRLAFTLNFNRCWRADSPPYTATKTCFLFDGFNVPGFTDPVCRECDGLIEFQEMFAQHRASGGPNMTYRDFRQCIVNNPFQRRIISLARWVPTQF
jgi:hypothetical protein